MRFEEIIAIEEKWANVIIPDKNEVQSMTDFAKHLAVEIDDLMTLQPKCWLLKESYEQNFLLYKTRFDFF